MFLTKLSLHGFKSFAHPVELAFGPGMTAVVGPNGSGKSNIADAMRWVLGEQSAKSLRGSKMEDVIFNGTQTMRPLGYCSVSLTFDNSDKALPLEYSEVRIARKYYRSGDSEYSINGVSCRLRDIVELFRDTGIGKEGYSIVGQGRIDEILSSRADDRRSVFEEAAGVSKYRARKEEAEQKLEKTNDNLLRIRDILSELSAQLEPLRLQSEKARQFLLLRDELRGIELNLFLRSYDKAQQRLANFSAQLEELTADIASGEEKFSASAALYSAHSEKLRAAEDEMALRQHELMDATTASEKRAGEINVLSERIENARRSAGQSEARINALREKLRLLLNEIAQKQENIDEAAGRSQTLAAAVQDSDTALKALDDVLQSESDALEKLKEQLYDAMNSVSSAKVQAGRLETMRASLEERSGSLETERAARQSDVDEIKGDIKSAEEGVAAIGADRNGIVERQKGLESQLFEINAQLGAGMEKRRELEKRSEAIRSRINVLTEMKQQHEGYYSSVRNLLRDCEKNDTLGRGVIGVLAELITVPRELETAFEMALGAALQNIVTENEMCAKNAINYLRAKNYGRATFLPLNAVKPRELSPSQRRLLTMPGVLGAASELIKFEKRYYPVVSSLLGGTVIVEDMDAGIAVMRASGGTIKLATKKGDIINPGGSMTGGSVAKREFSLLGRAREIEESAVKLAELENETRATEQSCQSLKTRAAALSSEIQSCARELNITDMTLTREREKADMLEKLLADRETLLEKLDAEKARLAESTADIQSQLNAIKRRQTALESGHELSQSGIVQGQKKLAELRTQRDGAFEELSARKLTLGKHEQELSLRRAELERLKKEKRSLEAEQTELADSRALSAGQLEKLAAQRDELISGANELKSEIERRLAAQSELEGAREQLRAELAELEARKDGLSRELAAAQSAAHKTELAKNRAEMELDNIQNKIWEDYELTYEGALAFEQEIDEAPAARRAEEIKSAMRELGDVNISAIDDYKSVSERHAELDAQHTDICAAKNDLEQLIEQLTSRIRRQFKSQFELINENFGAVFRELFDGGSAELRLADPDDILNSSIDIIAQPPGKKLQLLSLLSGGERSMTAIALLFAMLKLRPAPFCMLDEIEAALDEANVDNFANYVKRYSDKTQMILITHRKGSMVVCDTLYGVAMEEKGVTKLVSVKLKDYE